MNDAAFDERLQQLLDRRLDPLDDAQLVAWLDAHPERLPAFAALREGLQALTASPAVRNHQPDRITRRIAWPPLFAAAALLTFGLLSWRYTPQPATPHTPPSFAGRILHADLQAMEPRQFLAIDFAVRQPLLQTATLHFETYQLHHRLP